MDNVGPAKVSDVWWAMIIGYVLIDLAVVAAALYLYHRWMTRQLEPAPAESSQSTFERELYQLADGILTFFQASAHPEDLLRHESFLKGVSLLYPKPEVLTRYAQGDNGILACMALEAIAQRQDAQALVGSLIGDLNSYAAWPRYFALKAIRQNVPPDGSVVGEVLIKLGGDAWLANPSIKFLWRFIKDRVDAGEKLSFGPGVTGISAAQAGWLSTLLNGLGASLVQPLIDELQRCQQFSFDAQFLNSVGRVWGAGSDAGKIISHEDLSEKLDLIQTLIRSKPPRSILLVGDHGVGKTSLIRLLSERLSAESWFLFEAGHANLQAGQIYVGQLEERLMRLLKELATPRPVIWYVPEFHMLAWTGRSMNNPVSVLDMLLPRLESREFRLIGETTPEAYEKLVKSHPRCLTTFEVCRINPVAPQTALELGRRWAEGHPAADGTAALSPETLNEAWLLAGQYLSDKAAPGNLLELLKTTRHRLAIADGNLRDPISLADLVVTLARTTGLPDALIGSRNDLDISTLRSFFEKRVLGQPEAVDCLVERIAMMKAGVNDPTRPLGVFLFAGPTGTGKTVIAKALTEFLFGSVTRMIRLDMSEFQDPSALTRLVGDPNDTRSGALVDRIREQPFSVVLLDEFEKSHPKVWDLFLQVFDDGRLTDATGNTADCRHAIFILTSNLGAAIPTGLKVGFTREAMAFNETQVRQSIDRTFNREFLNRLDRIVVFRPLSRETIRAILRKELDEVFARRGLRNRAWAVVWDDSALEFLLEKGFTADLGARPLKRAVERYLLTPLAMTIVQHRFPEGDQFLIVKGQEDRLEVEFVDPDIPDETLTPVSAGDKGSDEGEIGLTSIMLDPEGSSEEIGCLTRQFNSIGEVIRAVEWQQNKQTALELMSQSGFWSSPERFALMGELEYLDRIEAGFETAGQLLDKLRQSSTRRQSAPRHLTERLAQQLYLLDGACASVRENLPRDAFLLVEAAKEPLQQPGQSNHEFARRLGEMYRQWAQKRRMNFKYLRERVSAEEDTYQMLAAVTGFGAYRILAPEDGLHVFEIPDGGREFTRAKALVRIAPQPDEPAGDSIKAWIAQAEEALARTPRDVTPVVRRYRKLPSPLVRDSVRKWRTGRFDRVLSGDFDLFA